MDYRIFNLINTLLYVYQRTKHDDDDELANRTDEGMKELNHDVSARVGEQSESPSLYPFSDIILLSDPRMMVRVWQFFKLLFSQIINYWSRLETIICMCFCLLLHFYQDSTVVL
jgi:hypothetical protein